MLMLIASHIRGPSFFLSWFLAGLLSCSAIGTPGTTHICTWKNGSTAAFSPTYDDMPTSGMRSLKDGFGPLHEKYQIKGTVGLVTGSAGTSADWKELKRMGEAGSLNFSAHTHTHPRLNQLAQEEMRGEFTTCNQLILDRTGQSVSTLIYPFGVHDEKVVEVASEFYTASRATIRGLMPFDSRDYQRVRTEWQVGNTTEAEISEWFTAALDQSAWLVTMGHAAREFSDGWEPMSLSLYEKTLELAKKYVDEGSLWNDHFDSIAAYLIERNNAHVHSRMEGNRLIVNLEYLSPLDDRIFSFPLTLRTQVPPLWNRVKIQQGNHTIIEKVRYEDSKPFVQFDAVPAREPIVISQSI